MLPDIRKIIAYEETINVEGGEKTLKELRLVGVAAVVKNPWIGKGFVNDLSPEIHRIAPVIGSHPWCSAQG